MLTSTYPAAPQSPASADSTLSCARKQRPPANDLMCVMDYRLSAFCWTRLQAASRVGPVLSLEMSADTRAYGWEKVERKGDFARVTLFPQGEADDAPVSEMLQRLHQALDEHRPATVAIVGWSFKWSLGALAWCLKNGVPAILLSDSTAISNTRRWHKEVIKRQLMKLYSVALVAGGPQRDYVASLGMPQDRIFRGWDIVDNDFYRVRSDAARANATQLRTDLQLPERYFISVSRFVEMKNVERLVEAYASYRKAAGAKAWKFLLIGDGPLRPKVIELQQRFNLGSDLILPGWKQTPELPAYYGLAGTFVLASTREPWGLVVNEAMASGLPVLISNRCGCSKDLVSEGRNGFTFDPLDVAGLAALMARVAEADPNIRNSMGEASRRIIAEWSPEVWAENLSSASRLALSLPRPSPGIFARFLLQRLIQQ